MVRSVVVLAVALVAALALSGAGNAAGQATQALAVSVDGPGAVTGSGINCQETSGDCVEIYTDGTSVTLTAAPSSGATFIGWGGDCSTTSTSCTFTMDAAKAVTATYTASASAKTLNVTVNGNGTVTGNGINCGNGNTDCSESYSNGTSVTLTETPGAGASFTGWGGDCSGTSTQCTMTMNSNRSVTATFTGSPTATLTVSATGSGKVTGPGIDCGNGATDCSENYATNTSVTLTETPASGASFTGWGGSCSGTGTTCTLTMTTAKSVTATFTAAPTTATLSVTVTGNGRVTGPGISCGSGFSDCSETYAINTSVTLQASPDAGAVFAGWSGACSGNAAQCTVVMSASRTVGAAFATDTSSRKLTVSVAGPGRVVASGISCGGNFTDCSESFPNGSRVTLTAVPAAGAVFLGWGGACTGNGTNCTVPLDTDRAVSASFAARRNNGNNGGTAAFSAVSLGNPLVVRTSVGWAVTLRFHVNQPSSALLRLRHGGRLLNAFTFSPRRGDVLVGPFHLGSAGGYRFELDLSNGRGGTAQLVWNLCLSSNPCNNFRPSVGFVRRGGVTFGRTANGWLIRARFNATRSGVGTAQMFVGGRRVSVGSFTFNRGQVVIDLPTTRRGTHRIVLTARDSAGRRVTVSWVVTIR